jgi:SAM-dependent methyltransferase
MRLKLPSGRRILVSPLLVWESRRDALLRLRTSGVFHPAHVTTRLSLGLLEECLQTRPCETLLDVGCGCGILALAGAAMGVGRAVGADIDWRAVRISRQNALENSLAAATVLEDLADDLARLLATDGTLLLSGFQDIDWHGLHNRLERQNLEIFRTLSGDFTFYGIPPSGSFTWMAVMARRRP